MTADPANDKRLMGLALREARKGAGRVNPNPMVGAVIVEGGEVVAVGHHACDGGPHAEVVALRNLGRKPAPGATMYVTLEPCSTHGRTGACTDAILNAGISSVVIGTMDPSPVHSGRAVEILRRGGVDVRCGVLEDSCRDLNLIFNHWATTGRPLVAAKLAMTLDGRIATSSGQSKWITGEIARRDVMHWRRLFPAISVAAGTVTADNPRLTARIGKRETCGLRVVFDRRLATVWDPLPNVYSDAFASQTVVVTGSTASVEAEKRLRDCGVDVWRCSHGDGHEWWTWFLAQLTVRRISGLLVEGGPSFLSGLWRMGALDYLFAYRAPMILGDEAAIAAVFGRAVPNLSGAIRLRDIRRKQLGSDDLIRGWLTYPE